MRFEYDEKLWNKKFGDKIRRMLHIRNMTQGRLAAEMGISEVVLSRYITGARAPSPYLVAKIASILDCDITWFYNVDD